MMATDDGLQKEERPATAAGRLLLGKSWCRVECRKTAGPRRACPRARWHPRQGRFITHMGVNLVRRALPTRVPAVFRRCRFSVRRDERGGGAGLRGKFHFFQFDVIKEMNAACGLTGDSLSRKLDRIRLLLI